MKCPFEITVRNNITKAKGQQYITKKQKDSSEEGVKDECTAPKRRQNFIS